MKKELLSSVILSIICIIFFAGLYPAFMWCVAQNAPNKGDGFVIQDNGKIYYTNIAQKFTDDKYFSSRPSAINYNAAGSAGSNKGPTNPEYLATVQERIDTFMAHNPDVKKWEIPSELVTASGSGLDPDISVQGAMVQVARIAKTRNISADAVITLIKKQTKKPLLGVLGPEKINVLKLNIELNNIK